MSDKNTVFNQKKTINAGGRLLDFNQPKVMGILNVTSDSFYSGNRFDSSEKALNAAERILSEGGEIIDIGAYSTRPGATDISVAEEKKRLLPIIKEISKEFPKAILSIDTFRAEVAQAAIDEGAHIINDVSGGELDEAMFETAAGLNVPYILMHMRGNPQTMSQLTDYANLLQDILQYFAEKIRILTDLGLKDIIIDPGFGFSKTIDQNFELLDQLDLFKITGLPILAGLSRKTSIWKTLNIRSEEALNGTTVLNTVALLKGASILRVHDVKEAVEAVKLVGKLQTS